METQKPPDSSQPAAKRKPYVKPACESEKILETTALACGKVPGGGGVCNAAPSSS